MSKKIIISIVVVVIIAVLWVVIPRRAQDDSLPKDEVQIPVATQDSLSSAESFFDIDRTGWSTFASTVTLAGVEKKYSVQYPPNWTVEEEYSQSYFIDEKGRKVIEIGTSGYNKDYDYSDSLVKSIPSFIDNEYMDTDRSDIENISLITLRDNDELLGYFSEWKIDNIYGPFYAMRADFKSNTALPSVTQVGTFVGIISFVARQEQFNDIDIFGSMVTTFKFLD